MERRRCEAVIREVKARNQHEAFAAKLRQPKRKPMAKMMPLTLSLRLSVVAEETEDQRSKWPDQGARPDPSLN